MPTPDAYASWQKGGIEKRQWTLTSMAAAPPGFRPDIRPRHPGGHTGGLQAAKPVSPPKKSLRNFASRPPAVLLNCDRNGNPSFPTVSVDSGLRPECANSSRSATAWRRGQIDPNRKFQVYERICGVRRKADLRDRLAASYRQTAHSQPRAYARVPNSVCALAITGMSGVGEKPSSAGERTVCASTRRPVD
jgi:hypothetical protein